MREIVFDTETTGLSFAGGDRLVEIGCVELINRVETGVTFHAYYHPERSMPAEAQAVHGISDAFLADKPLFAAVVHELIDFIGDSPLIAHNAGFDFSFINGELGRCGRGRRLGGGWQGVHAMSSAVQEDGERVALRPSSATMRRAAAWPSAPRGRRGGRGLPTGRPIAASRALVPAT